MNRTHHNPPMASRPALPTTRPPFERMMRLHHLLSEGSYPNCRTMAARVEVSEKTVQRDIEFMRDRLNLPIEYDPLKYGYYYARAVGSFPSLHVTEGELVALFVARKALEQYKGSELESSLRSAFDKISASLTDVVSFSWTDLDTSISFKPLGKSEISPALFQTLSQAVLERHQIVFEYRKLNNRHYEQRTVHPYHIACIDNQWYLFAHDLKREDIRTFSLPRIRHVQTTNIKFLIKNFSVADHLKNSFGVFSGNKTHAVKIHFDTWAAQLIREKHWHASQFITELANGEIELHLTLADLREVSRWIMSWGSHARVIEPRELKKMIREDLKKAALHYRE